MHSKSTITRLVWVALCIGAAAGLLSIVSSHWAARAAGTPGPAAPGQTAADLPSAPVTRRAPGGERSPAVAGQFYPASAQALRDAVQGYLKAADPAVPEDLREARPGALVVPHAGYTYSGGTAAFSYKLLEGKKEPSRVVLIGPTHHAYMPGACSVGDYGAFVTPLGKVPVDAEACRQLLAGGVFRSLPKAHASEHCLEVQLPFLQVLWPDPPKIVPIVVGQLNPDECREAAAGIAGILDEDTLVIVSSDFTHYGERFGFAPFAGSHGSPLVAKIKELDMGAVKLIEGLDPSGFRNYVSRTGATICGNQPIEIMLDAFSKSRSSRAVFLRWANSGQTTGEYEDCVSYVAAAVYAPASALAEIKKPPANEGKPSAGAAAKPEDAGAAAEVGSPNAGASGAASKAPPVLTDEHKRVLLKLARQAVTKAAEVGASGARQAVPVAVNEMPEALRANGGAFVTLKIKGELRGCIGLIEAGLPLCLTVREMAIAAALQDERFPPVSKEEVPQITIEISAMSAPQPAKGLEDIVVGRDGLIVSWGRYKGLLLPQVATEQGWTAREFLEQTCRKAGLPANAWQRDGVTIQRFTATIFGEEEMQAR